MSDLGIYIKNRHLSSSRELGCNIVTYSANITVNTPNGSITLEYAGTVPESETSDMEFFRACLNKQNELVAEIAKKQK